MRCHPVIGAEICRPLRSLKGQLPAIRHHHEHWDGTGYPDGLRQEDIPLGARITAVCDAWDAMTSTRCYRDALPAAQALEQLRQGAGSQWDAELVDLFVAHSGDVVELAAEFEERLTTTISLA